MFAVEDIEDVLARLRPWRRRWRASQVRGQVSALYVRGPEGIIVALAEQLS